MLANSSCDRPDLGTAADPVFNANNGSTLDPTSDDTFIGVALE